MKKETKMIHGGQHLEPPYNALMTPIYMSSSYGQEELGNYGQYAYSRTENPTRTALEKSLASIENGRDAIAFSSGIAAVDAALRLLKSGDHIIATKDIYGGSYRLFTQLLEQLGLQFSFVDLQDLAGLKDHFQANTRMVWVESPTNPLVKIVDISEIVKITKSIDPSILVGVDNTFASPYLQQPLDLGADISMHSATKFLSGHSDVILGALVVKDVELGKKLHFIQNAAGAIPSPMDCFLVLRGIKTLHLRMQRHCENAAQIAEFLRAHPKVEKVYYPGFKDHYNHQIAKKQMTSFGSMISFVTKSSDLESTKILIKKLKIFCLGVSLGGVESLVGHPVTMTHASVPKEEREALGIVDGLIRLSVGVEAVEDLIADLNGAL
ncbi:MAG: PLP-dependent transferase [Flavobacteriaceae bacterium]|nr:PLP-dependent transferase [Flavobacteriaceae bacterium]NVJ72480.1 PLP-dependent transferase [Flavobacteriaceae bacterium]